jgi:diguanylate cyclase (GGDEF)-like protein/PAS domain S-box-containing protein
MQIMDTSSDRTRLNRILVVDDDESAFLLVKHYLEQAKATAYELVWAADFEQAAVRIETERFAACLIDYNLGAGLQNGLEFLRRFARTQSAPPMILISGHLDAALQSQALEHGAVDCLSKADLSPQLLDHSLRYAMSRHDYRQQLWRSREHYRKIVEHSLNAITAIDRAGTIIEWNRGAEQLFGWRREEVIGAKFEEILVPRHRIRFFREWLANAPLGQQPAEFVSMERRVRHRDGREILVRASGTPIIDDEGVTFVGFYEDLTASREAAEAARRFESMVQSASDLIALLDRNLVFLAANNALLEAWGRRPDQVIGRHVKEVIGEELFELRRPIHERVLAGESLTGETWVQLPQQGRRYWSVHYDPYRDSDGNVIAMVVIARDITDQKRVEQALSHSNALISAVLRLQSQYIQDVEPVKLYGQLLEEVIGLTQSEFGFTGEIFKDEAGAPYLKTYALTDIAWDGETRALYDKAKDTGMEFHNLKTLFGAVITSREHVLSNDPDNDPRAGGLPPGHPRLSSFLGLPFNHGAEILGMIGLANRPGGYNEEMVRQLEVVTTASAGIIYHWQSERRLAGAELRYHALYDENPTMLFSLDADGAIRSANRYAAEQLGCELAGLIGHPVSEITHPDDVEMERNALREIFAAPGSAKTWELRKLRRNGESFWVRETARVTTAFGGGRMALVVCEDISGAKALSEQLSYQATHDVLTDLVNRREFERRLSEAINSARFHGAEHAMCFIDLDQFKVVNDTCGHAAGDALLRELAVILSRKIRRRDTLARLGGDEFVLLMEHCALDQARQIAANVHRVIADYRFSWQERQYRLGSSIGVVPVNNVSGDVNEVLRLADIACYAAKDAGRNTIHVYEKGDELLERRHGEMLWVERINRSLEQDLFRLAYQPIARVRGPKRGEHFELLIRLLGDDGRLIPPGAFLPAAERYGAIGRLDRWVVATWFKRLREHPGVLDRLTVSSINLSAHSVGDAGMLEFIQSEANRQGIPPQKICFELTETAAIANLSGAIEFMTRLRQAGFTFALDDFGVGLSSFAYLRSLPVSYVKIDGVFVREIARNNIDRAMVRSISDVAHSMGKMTIGEFVEDETILDALGELGVDYAQGYAIGRPQPVDTLLNWTPAPARRRE